MWPSSRPQKAALLEPATRCLTTSSHQPQPDVTEAQGEGFGPELPSDHFQRGTIDLSFACVRDREGGMASHKQTHARTTCLGQPAAGQPPRKQVVTAAGAGIEGREEPGSKRQVHGSVGYPRGWLKTGGVKRGANNTWLMLQPGTYPRGPNWVRDGRSAHHQIGQEFREAVLERA